MNKIYDKIEKLMGKQITLNDLYENGFTRITSDLFIDSCIDKKLFYEHGIIEIWMEVNHEQFIGCELYDKYLSWLNERGMGMDACYPKLFSIIKIPESSIITIELTNNKSKNGIDLNCINEFEIIDITTEHSCFKSLLEEKYNIEKEDGLEYNQRILKWYFNKNNVKCECFDDYSCDKCNYSDNWDDL